MFDPGLLSQSPIQFLIAAAWCCCPSLRSLSVAGGLTSLIFVALSWLFLVCCYYFSLLIIAGAHFELATAKLFVTPNNNSCFNSSTAPADSQT
jgi:hypothetical protein